MPSEVSITFSSQIQAACQAAGCPTYMMSVHPRAQKLTDGLFTLEHRPKKPVGGWRFHWQELRYAIGIMATAIRFRATVALIDSGATHFFLVMPLRLLGIRVVPILHNTLWPTGFYPESTVQRAVLQLDKWLFWRWVPHALVAVSPECERQVRNLVRRVRYPVHQVRAQFLPEYFADIPTPEFPVGSPFNVMFIGRVERMKGVFDILEMARIVESKVPGRVRWRICGRGKDLEELTRLRDEMNLDGIVELVGWVSLEKLKQIYGETHACIVPTRSIFTEALAMTAVESILAGRPLISNPVVPATELLRQACLLGKTDDPSSHAEAVLTMSSDADLYARLASACRGLGREFLDRQQGLTSAVRSILN